MNITDLITPQNESPKQLHSWQVAGCSTRPLGSYLKALGFMRIIKDDIAPEAQGYWHDNQFTLQSRETASQIVDKILTNYTASAVCTPWNGSSGFYKKKKKTRECDLVADILASNCDCGCHRFKPLKNTYEVAEKLLAEEGLTAKPIGQKKIDLINKLRSRAIEPTWAAWLDVVSVPQLITNNKGEVKQEFAYPGLTGLGGIIGNKDMGVCFVEALNYIWDLQTGCAKKAARKFIESSLLGIAHEQSTINRSLLTQFYPVNDFLLDISNAKGHSVYAKSGSSTALCNPFDAVLIYEGLLTFSGVSCRIKNKKGEKTQATFSFAVKLAVGTADVTSLIDSKYKTEEIWVPIWSTPKTYDDLLADIFNKNRHPLSDRQVVDTVDQAHQLSKWSRDHNINRYIRYAFLPRKGKGLNFAIPVGEFIPQGQKSQDLAAQLNYFRYGCRQIANSKYASAAMISAISVLEQELLKLSCGNGSYLKCLIQLGILEQEITYSHILNQNTSYVRALPYLRFQWLDRALAEDKSAECRLGIAIASLKLRDRATKIRVNARGKLVWLFDARIDWGKRSLVDNLIALQRRWSIERAKGLSTRPNKLVSPSFADLDRFIRGRVDDRKISQIALGASICTQKIREFKGGYLETLPPQYAIGALCQWGKTEDSENIGGEELVLNYLSRGKPQAAMSVGLQRLRTKGMVPYLKHPEDVPNSQRIAAAMAFPLSENQLDRLKSYHIKLQRI